MAGQLRVDASPQRRHRPAWARAPRALACGIASALLAACANAPPAERSVLLGAENKVFLILPLNLAAVMPPELEGISPIVWEELERYLRAQGKQLKTVSRATARGLWLESIKQARAGEKGARAGFDDAARMLAAELRKHASFDVMIAPSLYVREAPIANRAVYWDGVERELEFVARGLQARNLAATPVEGAAPAASLHVVAFDANGEKLHEGRGGLDLLVRVRVTGDADTGEPSFAFETRDDVFQDREHVREGIAAAFAGMLPALSR